MLVLPTILLTLSGISGAGGITLSVKSFVDSMEASSTNRYVQEQNEKYLLRFEAVSRNLDEALEMLGEQRMIIAKNFRVFIKAFEQIHNRPEFSTKKNSVFPSFSFDEIKNVSVVANSVVGAAGGAVVGSALGAAAASGTTSAIIALGKASTGAKIAELHGAVQTKAALAALGGGAKAAGGGGIALGTVVLNAATLGVATLIEGIAMAYASSVAKKEADKAKSTMEENERLITSAIEMQLTISVSCDKMCRASAKICNGIYKNLVFQLKELVANKNDWNEFTVEEKRLVENCILVVQILNHLINIPMYIVKRSNYKGEIEEVEPNTEIYNAIINSRKILSEVMI